MRLKALLIDDEVHILKNLQVVLPWDELEVEVVGLAKNGVQALELVSEHHPDIILCDIRMPVMDGIAFLGKLRELGEEAEVIMLTGYQDFEYARSVMKFGVRDYVLKPIDYEELTNIIGRLAGTVRERRRERNVAQAQLGQAVHLVHEKMLYDILMDYSSVQTQFMFDDVEVDASRFRYILMLADIDDYTHKYRFTSEQDRKLRNFAVRNVLQDALQGEELHYAVLQMREGEWCIVLEKNEAEPAVPQTNVRHWAELLQAAVESHVGVKLSIGVHPQEIPIQELSATYRSLQKTVHLASGKDRSILLSSEGDAVTDGEETLWATLEQLVSSLKRNDREAVESVLQQLTARVQSVPGRSLAHAEKLVHFAAMHLMREMRDLNVLSAEEEKEIWTVMEQATRVKDMLAVVRRIMNASLESSMNRKSGDVLMHTAKDYIGTHLSRDLGVDEVAGSLGISASYFSQLFKQHVGCTFVEYVTAERITLAKSLLLMTDRSITDIGRSVGYAERRYFTKVFHKITGEIPSEFREKRAGKNKEQTWGE
ncbi:AraC family transcriptional regulator [Paenibacillus sp. CCS19]|uniref:response regulator transcription factor n=1 Tax=Paenibacillus sp. CCS19 TaxID=3158387 RepID=UPI00256C9526|nr:response regulator [Paenibacillus cellulosilyticus]GMK42384.1 AraC family transcriptional regulator [Paenibacillus cellulosilyticus]